MKYKLFKNVYFHQVDDGWVGVYNPLKEHKLIFLKKDISKALLKFKKPMGIESLPLRGTASSLIEHKFLLPEDFDQNLPINNIGMQITKNPNISLMYLLVTNNCNFGCTYCFIKNDVSRGPLKNMSKETCLNAIDYFARIADKNIQRHSVVFYGGEPLLNAQAVKEGCIKLRKLESEGALNELDIIINTNATEVDSSWVDFFRTHHVNPSVSIDGPEEIHNSARKTLEGKGTFYDSYKGFMILKESGLPIGISCTISETNLTSLDEVARFFVQSSPSGVGFNPLIGEANQKACTEVLAGTPKALLKAFEILREAGIYEDRVMRRLRKIINKELYIKECAAYGNQIVVSPTGEIGPCHGFLGIEGFFKGNVNNDPITPTSDQLFIEWNSRTPFNMEECFDCPFIGICGGGCAYTAYVEGGSIWKRDLRMYKFCKALLEWIIEDMWNSKKEEFGL